MNILILTSAMLDNDYSVFQEHAKIKPNPSNQIFYSKLIRSLGILNNVAVISHRPLAKGMFQESSFDAEQTISKGIRFFYTNVKTNIFYKLFEETNEIVRTAKFAIDSFLSNDFVIVVDSLRYHLVDAALKLSKIYNVKIIGVLTDNPLNLSDVNNVYATSLKNKIAKFDGYLSLTKKLAENFNKELPCYVFEGLVANEEGIKKDRIVDYFFFAGSLYERYGVKTLVDAYHNSLCKSKLVIAGNGPLANYIDNLSKIDPRILYLSQLSHEKVVGYELNAVANINPRPTDIELDSESVPSKLLEYLSMGVPTISSKYERLYSLFEENAFWIEDNTQKSLESALEKFESTSEALKLQRALSAKQKVFEIYSLEVQGELITHFLYTIIK